MSTENAQLAASAASLAASGGTDVVSWLSVAKGIFGKIFGGSGYATTRGFELRGYLTPSGYQGTVTGITSNGSDVYRVTEAEGSYGEHNAFNAYTINQWQASGLSPNDAPIPLNLNVDADFFISDKLGLTVSPVFAKYKSLLDEQAANLLATINNVVAPIIAPVAEVVKTIVAAITATPATPVITTTSGSLVKIAPILNNADPNASNIKSGIALTVVSGIAIFIIVLLFRKYT